MAVHFCAYTPGDPRRARETPVARPLFDVVPCADFCGLCMDLRRRAHPCKHIIYTRGLELIARKDGLFPDTSELPWWACDTPCI